MNTTMNIDFTQLSTERLETMFEAGSQVLEVMRAYQNSKEPMNVSKDITRFAEEFKVWDHVPKGDIYDKNSNSQFYFHSHAKAEDNSGVHDDEHGHFHTFMRGNGFPKGVMPITTEDYNPEEQLKKPKFKKNDFVTHLIAIATDNTGTPMRLFTTNRWVVADTWVKAEDLVNMLDQFEVDHTQPTWAVNIWVTNMVRFYRPQIEQLILQRDKTIAAWQEKHPDRNVYEDHELEVTSLLEINLIDQLDAVEAALEGRQ